jgi:DNA repair protein RecO (recombination protein O)
VKGLVLNKIKYKDALDIVYLYTDVKGRKTCLLNRKNKSGRIYPLSIIEFETNGKQKAEIQYIKEYVFSPVLPEISSDIKKSAVAMFIGEFLYKILKEEELNYPLFDFVCNSIMMLDLMNEGVANFHLYFMVQLSKYLGFSILPNIDKCSYFDIKLCRFAFIKPLHPQFFNPENTEILTNLLEIPADRLKDLKLSGIQRIEFANKMLDFYSFRFDHNLIMKSIGVIHEIFT